MEVKATARFQRISPRKTRQVIDLIRGKDVAEASALLHHTPRKAADFIAKVLKSAVANAEHNEDLLTDNLYVHQAFVDQGPGMKRIKPRAYGQRDIMKRPTSHITVILKEREED